MVWQMCKRGPPSQDVEALRSWRFEGSRDQVTWTLLRHHVNDSTLCKKGQVAVFAIDEAAVYGVASGAVSK
jgi:hypothetical protein